MESNGHLSDPKEDPKDVSSPSVAADAQPETPAAGNTIICLDVAMINVKTKLELNALFAFDCTGTGGDDCEAQQQSVLQSDDSLRLKLDFASAAQAPSTPNGPNIISALKDMTDEDRAAVLRAISEQFSTSLVASTPQGQGVSATYTTPATTTREKRRAQLVPNASKKAKQICDEAAPAESSLERLAAAADAIATDDLDGEQQLLQFAPASYPFPESVQTSVGKLIFESNKNRYYYIWLIRLWQSDPEPWMQGHPIPDMGQVQIWARRYRRRAAAEAERYNRKHPMSKKAIKEGQALNIRTIQENAGASNITLSLSEMIDKVPSKLLSNILSQAGSPEQCHSMLPMLCLVNKRLHDFVKTTTEYKDFQIYRQQQIDLKRILEQVDLSLDSDSADSEGIYHSEKQIPIEYGKTAPEVACPPDVKESLANLGDALPFVERLRFLGKGGFGAVFAMEVGGRDKMALKVGHNAVSASNVSTLFLSEFTFSKLSDSLNKARQPTRNQVEPFAPDVPTFIEENFDGCANLAVPSKNSPNKYYPVLALPVAKMTLDDAISELSSLFNDPWGKCRPEDLRCVASLTACILEKLRALHCTGNSHRDVKGSNFLGFSPRPGMKGRVYTSPSGRHVLWRLNDFGKAVSFGQKGIPEKPPVLLSTSSKSRHRAKQVLAKHVPFRGYNEHAERVLEQRKAVEVLLQQPDLLPKRIAVKGGKDGAPGLYAVSTRALHLQNGCFPSQAKSDDPPVPLCYAGGYGTAHFAPPESPQVRNEREEFLSSRAWQSGDMWAVGLMVAEMVKGKGRRIVFSPDDTHGKVLFAQDGDKLFWNKHLDKKGDIPDEWEQCIDLIRNLCAYDPNERLTASAALRHPFITQLETNLES